MQQTLDTYGIHKPESTKNRELILRIQYWTKQLYEQKKREEKQTQLYRKVTG